MYIIFVGKDGFSTSMFLRFPQGLSHLMNFLIKTSIYRGFPIFSHDFPILKPLFLMGICPKIFTSLRLTRNEPSVR